MSVSLAWLLARRSLGLTHLEGPDPATVEVRWAHAVELVDPTPWLEGGELLLTTGLRLPRSVAGLTSYVRRLADAGVAALGFGTGLEYAEAPRTMRKACAKAGLPLVEVPLPTAFLAVIRAIADHESEQQRAALRDAVAFQQRLTRAALDHGATGLVAALAQRLTMPVVVMDDLGTVVAERGSDDPLRERVRREVGTDNAAVARTVPYGADDAMMLLRLGDTGRTRGWLAVQESRPSTSQERLLVGQVASMLTLQLTRSTDLADLHTDLGSVAADLALDGAPDPLTRFGLAGPAGVKVVVAGSTRDRPIAAAALARALDPLRRPHVCTVRGEHAVALVSGDLGPDSLAAIHRNVVAEGRSDVVLGSSTATPTDRLGSGLSTGLSEATRAMEAARSGGRPTVAYSSLELETLLDDDAVRGRVADLAGGPLSSLLASGRPADRELVRTLRVFLETNGSWETASRRLGVHRHTLRQRISRLSATTGLDLDSAHTRAATLLVLLAHDRDS